MTMNAPGSRDPRICLLAWAGLVGALLLALAGCASPQPGEAGSSRDIVTESDEPEARKRAIALVERPRQP